MIHEEILFRKRYVIKNLLAFIRASGFIFDMVGVISLFLVFEHYNIINKTEGKLFLCFTNLY